MFHQTLWFAQNDTDLFQEKLFSCFSGQLCRGGWKSGWVCPAQHPANCSSLGLLFQRKVFENNFLILQRGQASPTAFAVCVWWNKHLLGQFSFAGEGNYPWHRCVVLWKILFLSNVDKSANNLRHCYFIGLHPTEDNYWAFFFTLPYLCFIHQRKTPTYAPPICHIKTLFEVGIQVTISLLLK